MCDIPLLPHLSQDNTNVFVNNISSLQSMVEKYVAAIDQQVELLTCACGECVRCGACGALSTLQSFFLIPFSLLGQVEKLESEKLKAVGLRNKVAALSEVSKAWGSREAGGVRADGTVAPGLGPTCAHASPPLYTHTLLPPWHTHTTRAPCSHPTCVCECMRMQVHGCVHVFVWRVCAVNRHIPPKTPISHTITSPLHGSV
jgi:hypothetical protein